MQGRELGKAAWCILSIMLPSVPERQDCDRSQNLSATYCCTFFLILGRQRMEREKRFFSFHAAVDCAGRATVRYIGKHSNKILWPCDVFWVEIKNA